MDSPTKPITNTPGPEQPGSLLEQLAAIATYRMLLTQLRHPNHPALWQLARERTMPHARRYAS